MVNNYAIRFTQYVLRFTFYIFLSLVILSWAIPALAQDSEPVSDDEVNEVAKDLYCPVCENTPLDVCPTQACADWRELIREKLGEGETKEEIFDYFARQYGDSVLAQPPRRGFNLVLWLFPIVAVAVGVVFFGRYMRGLKVAPEAASTPSGEPEPAPADPLPADDYTARIEEEL